MKPRLCNLYGPGLISRNAWTGLRAVVHLRHQEFHERVMSDCAEATTMSILGPVRCSALTVIDPLDPPDELVCWLM